MICSGGMVVQFRIIIQFQQDFRYTGMATCTQANYTRMEQTEVSCPYI